MKYVQINSFYNGSTGTIMRNLHKKLQSEGHDSYIFWGREHKTINEHEQCFTSNLGVNLHGVCARLTDRVGFYSVRDTKRLLEKLDEINPDVVHLHNIHGYYINIEMLFCWLKKRGQLTYWTLHDCWSFTGHCSYFTYVKCDQWENRCSSDYKCPQVKEYPKSILMDNCGRNFDDKKRIFTSLGEEQLIIITPSQWLATLVERSFLARYRVEVRHNQIDKTVFKKTPSDLRERFNLNNLFLVLGVASPWSKRKGLDDFIRLSQDMRDGCAIVVVGLDSRQMNTLPLPIIGLPKTSSKEELAGYYSAADVLFNPTKEDNYPTVNLEAEACGTPVVTYDTGGCRETVHNKDSYVAEGYEDALNALNQLKAEAR